VRKTGESMLKIYTLYDVFLLKELPFGGRSDCNRVKIFGAN